MRSIEKGDLTSAYSLMKELAGVNISKPEVSIEVGTLSVNVINMSKPEVSTEIKTVNVNNVITETSVNFSQVQKKMNIKC